MEEIHGSYMRAQLTVLNATDPIGYGRWLANVAKNCFVGYGDLNLPVLTKLDKGLTISHLKRDGLGETMAALDLVATNRNLESLAQAMLVLVRATCCRPFGVQPRRRIHRTVLAQVPTACPCLSTWMWSETG